MLSGGKQLLCIQPSAVSVENGIDERPAACLPLRESANHKPHKGDKAGGGERRHHLLAEAIVTTLLGHHDDLAVEGSVKGRKRRVVCRARFAQEDGVQVDVAACTLEGEDRGGRRTGHDNMVAADDGEVLEELGHLDWGDGVYGRAWLIGIDLAGVSERKRETG